MPERSHMLRYIFLSFVLASSLGASAAFSDCIVIDGPNIEARNLASIYPAFLALDGNTMLSYAPAPGSRRTVSAPEISSWARSRGLVTGARDGACFERAGFTRTANDYREAIREQLKVTAGAEIEVLDFYSRVLPPGRLELPVAGAAVPPPDHPETPFIWRGQLISSDGGSYPVWARVTILANRNVVRPVRDLPAGAILEAQQLTSAPERCNPLRPGDSQPLSFYIGKSLIRSVTKGSRLDPGVVQDPPAVRRGDKVRVSVVNGSAHLELDAFANGAGNVGDSILLRNPAGSKYFRAIITGVGRAEVLLNGSDGEAKSRTAVQTFLGKGSS